MNGAGARAFLTGLLMAIVVSAASAALAEDEGPVRPVEDIIAGWGQVLDSVDAYVGGLPYTAARHAAFSAQLSKIGEEARSVAAQAQTVVEANSRLRDALGPPPGADGPDEAGPIAQTRRELSKAIAAARAQISHADLARARAAGLQEELSQAYRRSLIGTLSQRLPSPLTPARLAPLADELAAVTRAIVGAPWAWLADLSSDTWREFWINWRMLLLAGVLILGGVFRLALLRRLGRDTTIAATSYTRRLVAAIAESVVDGVVPAIILAGLYFRVQAEPDLAEALAGRVVAAACAASVFLILTAAFSRAVLAPDLPQWRLTSLAPGAARMLNRRIILLAAIYSLDVLYSRATEGLVLSPDLLALYAMVMSGLGAMGIVAVMQDRVWRGPAETTDPAASEGAQPMAARSRAWIWTGLRWSIIALALSGMAAAAAGYVRLGHYLIGNILISGAVFAGVHLCRGLLRECLDIALRSDFMARRCMLGDRTGGLIRFALEALTGPLLAAVGLYLVLPSWGVPGEDIRRWLAGLLGGVIVGGIRLSPLDVFVAVGVFTLALLVTRVVRQALAERVLPLTNLDFGIRNSISVGMGYVGSTIAVLLAIAILGIDLSSLAIVAGALSVGIGFGLQNIVNNFISGLILLVERPIKAGDWVVVGTQEGYVKRINVRATEIETFERASVILPNSELLQSAVLNWTHKDKTGRVEVGVGVAYGSDTQRVREILLACAKQHPEVSGWPTPYVVFRNFGASSLDFEVRAFIKDIEKRLTVASDLRFAIDQAFRENHIEVPFAQHDVHLRDLDRLEHVLAGLRGDSMPSAVVPFSGGRPANEVERSSAPGHAPPQEDAANEPFAPSASESPRTSTASRS